MKSSILMGIAFTIMVFSGCKKNKDENMIPNVPVSIRINMDLPLYANLLIPGNYIYLNGGNKGITLFHGFNGEYYATDRMCPYQPFEECSRVELDSNFTFRCGNMQNGVFQKCCESKFQFDGLLLNGPSIYPLKNYRVFKSGNIIDISN
ncbi:MAG: hypothetical protein J5I91_07040 [Bacteroidetes bacterium]|nr:hypothetical protein [Bacteroidota bacterium]